MIKMNPVPQKITNTRFTNPTPAVQSWLKLGPTIPIISDQLCLGDEKWIMTVKQQ